MVKIRINGWALALVVLLVGVAIWIVSVQPKTVAGSHNGHQATTLATATPAAYASCNGGQTDATCTSNGGLLFTNKPQIVKGAGAQ